MTSFIVGQKLGQQATNAGMAAMENASGSLGPAEKSITTERESEYIQSAENREGITSNP